MISTLSHLLSQSNLKGSYYAFYTFNFLQCIMLLLVHGQDQQSYSYSLYQLALFLNSTNALIVVHFKNGYSSNFKKIIIPLSPSQCCSQYLQGCDYLWPCVCQLKAYQGLYTFYNQPLLKCIWKKHLHIQHIFFIFMSVSTNLACLFSITVTLGIGPEDVFPW